MDCFAEPVIGRRFAPTRWLHPGYACHSKAARPAIIADTMLSAGVD